MKQPELAATAETPILDAYDRRRIESLSNPLLFDELLAMASQASFGHQLEFAPYEKSVAPRADLIAKLGVRGLRTAFDLVDNARYVQQFDGERTDQSGQESIWVDSPLRSADLFSDQPDLEILDKARQFGQAFLAESYRGLGQDVFAKIREFQAAESDQAQIEIIAWLDHRLCELADSNRGLQISGQTENDGQYHPIRLSPKAIGVYPNHALAPTCLGVSVMAASFFEQAGAPHLHAGVMVNGTQDGLVSVIGLLSFITDKLAPGQPAAAEAITARLMTLQAALQLRYNQDDGYHAANLVRLSSGQWCQFDSNFGATTIVKNDFYNTMLSERHQQLTELDPIAPGLETSLEFSFSSLSGDIEEWVEAVNFDNLDVSIIGDILTDEIEAVPEKIKQAYIDPFFAQRPEGLSVNVNANLATVLELGFGEYAFYELFSKYVLWGQPLEVVQARCRQDPEYLDRRLADVANLRLIMVGAIAIKYENYELASGHTNQMHGLLEAGLPARRIGLAVLSDYAAYCDNRLPPSFWITHWPSQIPLTETLAGAERSSGQLALLQNNASLLYDANLSYAKSSDIIYRFLIAHQEEAPDAES